MRCYVCDATPDGALTHTPFNPRRIFSYDQHRPWLEICSDCEPTAEPPKQFEDGEVPLLEEEFDD